MEPRTKYCFTGSTPFAGQRKLTGSEELVLTQLARRAKVDRSRLASVQTSTVSPPQIDRSSPRTGQLRLIAKGGQSMTAGDSWGIEGDLTPKAGRLASGNVLQNGPMFHEDWILILVKSDQLRSISPRPRVIFSRSLQYCWWARCYVLPSELLFIVRICIPI